MPGFVDEFMAQLGPEVTKQLSKNLGIKKKCSQSSYPAARANDSERLEKTKRRIRRSRTRGSYFE
jgi:hypothetical protein